jgi:hypothetical protein
MAVCLEISIGSPAGNPASRQNPAKANDSKRMAPIQVSTGSLAIAAVFQPNKP